MRKQSTSSRSPKAFACPPTPPPATPRRISCWASTANPSPRRSTSSCRTVAFETIRCGPKWFASLTTVTPTTPNACRIDVSRLLERLPRVSRESPAIAKFFGARFVRQDQETMIQQAEGLKYNPSLMLIDDADRPAKWYFALKHARLDAARRQALQTPAGRPGNVTLAKLSKIKVHFADPPQWHNVHHGSS